jgi:hypothetical protein
MPAWGAAIPPPRGRASPGVPGHAPTPAGDPAWTALVALDHGTATGLAEQPTWLRVDGRRFQQARAGFAPEEFDASDGGFTLGHVLRILTWHVTEPLRRIDRSVDGGRHSMISCHAIERSVWRNPSDCHSYG